jgi:hypothetical protein
MKSIASSKLILGHWETHLNNVDLISAALKWAHATNNTVSGYNPRQVTHHIVDQIKLVEAIVRAVDRVEGPALAADLNIFAGQVRRGHFEDWRSRTPSETDQCLLLGNQLSAMWSAMLVIQSMGVDLDSACREFVRAHLDMCTGNKFDNDPCRLPEGYKPLALGTIITEAMSRDTRRAL